MNRTSLLAAASLAWTVGVAAQDNPAQAPRLGEVNVTATRSERAIEDTAATVTVIDAQEIERRQVRGIGDLIRYEPGVNVRGLNYAGPAERYGGAFTATAVAKKARIDDSASNPFPTPGFTLFDLTGYWRPLRNLTLSAALFNLFDKKYWLWPDLWRTGLTSVSPGLDRYTQPGRNAAVTVKLEF